MRPRRLRTKSRREYFRPWQKETIFLATPERVFHMLIIPPLKCIVLQPPRTGSTALREGIFARYPSAFTPYRHMERDGIPDGYEMWRTIVMVRHPFDRMASLYRYMGNFTSTSNRPSGDWKERMRRDVDRSFEDWLEGSMEVFTDPIGQSDEFIPFYHVQHPRPIARKGAWWWARPDMGEVEVLRLENVKEIETTFDVTLDRLNASSSPIRPQMSARVMRHLRLFHSWDLALYEG